MIEQKMNDQDELLKMKMNSRTLHTIVKQLIPLLKDEDEYVRCAATGAIGCIGYFNNDIGESSIRLLIEMLKDKEFSVRVTATNAIGKLGAHDPVFAELGMLPLIELLKKEVCPDAKRKIIDAIEGAAITPTIRPTIRQLAVESLRMMMEDKHVEVRKAALKAIELIIADWE